MAANEINKKYIKKGGNIEFKKKKTKYNKRLNNDRIKKNA